MDTSPCACAYPQIGKGELVCVVGRVGSGKSSLVQALLGEMEKAAGTVSVGGMLEAGGVAGGVACTAQGLAGCLACALLGGCACAA